jgi:carboxymethylenebutenolidase
MAALWDEIRIEYSHPGRTTMNRFNWLPRALLGGAMALGVLAVLTASAAAQDQAWAKARIDNSPRHAEWVEVKHGDRTVRCWIAFPEVREKAPVIIVIHEIFGLSDWIRSVTDQLAEVGYIAIAPDLLSGMAPNGGGTEELGTRVRDVIGRLPPEQITADLNAVAEYATKLPAASGNISVTGFCWGGGETLRYATNNKNLKAAYPFYGSPRTPLTAEEVARINCPVYGFYAENDMRVNANIPRTKELMEAAKKTYEPVTYAGGGHGFMRGGEDPNGREGDKKARTEAWTRWKELLKKTAAATAS